MCHTKFIAYSCGCKTQSEFVQCAERQGTNLKCHPLGAGEVRQSGHYCANHLVRADVATQVYRRPGDKEKDDGSEGKEA